MATSIESMNSQTAQLCSKLAAAATKSISWNKDAATANNRLRLDQNDNYHAFLRTRLAARKLGASAARAPCVGVFGPSQAGKSYLVSALSKGKHGSLMVQLGDQLVDFLQQINPGGGRESTGVVTRFSISKPRLLDTSFPVEIRLLSECDVIKILFNSFFSDFDHAGSITLAPFKDEQIRKRIQSLETYADFSSKSVSLEPEDVLDIKAYVESSFANLVSDLKADFWPAAIALAPYLSIEKRANLFAVVWRDFPLFTELYVLIAKTLESLNGAEACLAPLNSVISQEGEVGIVDAQLLTNLGKSNGPLIEIRPVISGKPDSSIRVPKAVLAALTAELKLTISQGRWDFLSTLDILDFPGARSRLKISDPAVVDSETKSQAAELYLRGKVAYLFQRYTTDQEMSAVLLCVPWGPQEVTGYAALIDNWVSETNGNSPEKRGKIPPGLLLVLTKFDMDLQSKGGDNEITEKQRWPDRIKSSLLERFGTFEWVSKWDEREFRNLFWLRNPEIRDSAYMSYEDGVEVAINPQHSERIRRLRQYFIEDAQVGKHFDQPAEAWDAAMIPQDGGITRIVSGIDRLADPAYRAQMLHDKAKGLADLLIFRLTQYFNEGGNQEVLKKIETVKEIKRDLTRLILNKDIWKLFDRLNLTLAELRTLYFMVATGTDLETPAISQEAEPAAPNGPDVPNLEAILATLIHGSDAGGDSASATTQAPVPHPRSLLFAQKVIDAWASKLRDMAHDSSSATSLLCPEHTLSLLVEELIAAAQRNDLRTRLALLLNPAENNAGTTWEKIVDRQITIARNILGDFVSELGMCDIPLRERPSVAGGQIPRRVFEPFPNFNEGVPPLTETPLVVPILLTRDWLVALDKLVVENAGFQGQDSLGPALNSELGSIISTIKSV